MLFSDMKNYFPFIGFVLLLAAASCFASEINFEIYERKDSHRILLGKGAKSYGASDFSMRRENRDGKFYGVRKALPLYDGYSIGTLDRQGADVSGFGLWVVHLPFDSNPNEFSWEWYDRKTGGNFTKLQGGSRIKVLFGGAPLIQEIRRVEFLDDVELDYTKDLCCKSGEDGSTHVLVIRAGSVLEFPHGS